MKLQRNKRVIELKPAGIDQSTAVAKCLAESPFRGRCPVFIGHDLNCEHGFTEVNRICGTSIKVGLGPSCANFRLSEVAAVRRWLNETLKGGR